MRRNAGFECEPLPTQSGSASTSAERSTPAWRASMNSTRCLPSQRDRLVRRKFPINSSSQVVQNHAAHRPVADGKHVRWCGTSRDGSGSSAPPCGRRCKHLCLDEFASRTCLRLDYSSTDLHRTVPALHRIKRLRRMIDQRRFGPFLSVRAITSASIGSLLRSGFWNAGL